MAGESRNYTSGDAYALEFLGYQFSFGERDFEERVVSAAVKLGLVPSNDLEPEEVAYQDRLDIDKSYVRCLKVLLAGEGYPMIATHDPRLVEIAEALASRYGRAQGSYEFQMLHGVRPAEQRRLAASGERVRVYLPYGEQ